MPKVRGVREKQHQAFWDTLIRGDVDSGTWAPRTPAQIAGSVRLFVQPGQGNLSVSNMESGGSFPSDQSYRILAMRVWLYFSRGLWPPGPPAPPPFGPADIILYHHALIQLYWELNVAGKTQFQGPTSYLPMGGGLFGDVGNRIFGGQPSSYFCNGNPTQGNLCKFARSIALPARQNFYVQSTLIPLGGAFTLVEDIAALLTGEIAIVVFIDGLRTRDVL